MSNLSTFSHPPWLVGALLALASALFTAPGAAQSLLLGPEPAPRQEVPLDPRLPTGEARWPERPQPQLQPLGCSARRPVCVQAPADLTPWAPAALQALEDAWDLLVVGRGLPAPVPPVSQSHAAVLWSLTDASPMGTGPDALETQVSPLAPSHLGDRGTTVCVGRPGASLERTALHCVAEASLAAIAPATSSHARRAWAAEQGRRLLGVTADELSSAASLGRSSTLALWSTPRSESSAAAGLFLEFLESRLGSPQSLPLSTSLVLRHGTHTAAGARWWNAEPDLLDVLASTLRGSTTSTERLWAEFSLWRRSPNPPQGYWSPQWWALQRPPPDWTLPLSTLPRRVAFRTPVEPTGSLAVWVPFDVLTSSTLSLGMRATCEAPASYAWAMARLDERGEIRGEVPIAFEPERFEVERTVLPQPGDAGLLLTGTSLGGVDSRHPYDPDIHPPEPHGCVVYLTPL